MQAFMEWIQSIEGIITLSLGGMSIGTVITNIAASFKSIKNSRDMNNIFGEVNNIKGTITSLVKAVENRDVVIKYKEEEIKLKDLQLNEQAEIQRLTFKAISIIVASAGGIDPMTKVALLEEIGGFKTKNENDLKALAIPEIKEEEVAAFKEVEKVVNENKEVADQLETYIQKAVEKSTTDKYKG